MPAMTRMVEEALRSLTDEHVPQVSSTAAFQRCLGVLKWTPPTSPRIPQLDIRHTMHALSPPLLFYSCQSAGLYLDRSFLAHLATNWSPVLVYRGTSVAHSVCSNKRKGCGGWWDLAARWPRSRLGLRFTGIPFSCRQEEPTRPPLKMAPVNADHT